ncbi:MAG: SDR family NAD(P)-dependent oxidoreductase [Acidobacteriota bacterium]
MNEISNAAATPVSTPSDDLLDREIDVDLDEELAERAVAVIGMAGRFPGAADLSSYWDLLRRGDEAVEELSPQALSAAGVSDAQRADARYVPFASRLADVDAFDAELFGYTAREAEILDPQQRIFMEQCWHALEDAAIDPARHQGLIGVYAGVAWNTYLLSQLMSHRELFEEGGAFQVFITSDKDFMPTRVAYKLDLKGPAVLVQTSCSTSLVATHLASLSLQNYECDVALAGGVTVKVPQDVGYHYLDGGLASPDGRCRPFDAKAAGTIFGSGAGVVVLKRLSDAIEDGDRIRAVLRGSAINNDGSSKVSYTAPSVEGQARVVADAQAVAGVEPDTVGYIETHGTGTSLGDPIEVAALTKVFSESTEDKEFCALGSVKSNVGHLDAAAGVAGLIKTVLGLEHGEIPPSLHFETPNPAIDFASSPFYVNQRLSPWRRRGENPRRGGVSSFGVGGTNAHAVVEEAPPAAESAAPARAGRLLVLSAASPQALDRSVDALVAQLEAGEGREGEIWEDRCAADVAWTLQTGRRVLGHRAAAVWFPQQGAAALTAADRWVRGRDEDPPRERPVAFLFPGQGSQYLRMGLQLRQREEVFREALGDALKAVEAALGESLEPVLYPSPEAAAEAEAKLTRTAYAQPALFALQYAFAAQWRSWGVEPWAVAGHSVGHLAAAVTAGVFTLDSGARLAVERGRLMDAQPAGAMAAVPLAVEELEQRLPAELAIAAINEVHRTVIAGPRSILDPFLQGLEEEGIEARRLRTSHAFHSAMMEPAVAQFRQAVAAAKPAAPNLPMVSDRTGTWLRDDEAQDADYWAGALVRPVRFTEVLSTLFEANDGVLLELGPGQALTTSARRHPQRQGRPVVCGSPHPRSAGEPAAESRTLLEALGRLWVAGREIRWDQVHDGHRRRKVSLPGYPFARNRYWIEARPDAAAGAAAELTSSGAPVKIADPRRWLYLPSWKPTADGVAVPQPQNWWLVGDGVELGALTQQLGSGGSEVVSTELQNLRALLAEGADVTDSPWKRWAELVGGSAGGESAKAEDSGAAETEVAKGAILYAPSLAAGDLEAKQDPSGAGALLPLLRLLRRALEQVDGTLDLWVVTAGALAVGPAERPNPAHRALLGLARVIPQEFPRLRCRVVDLEIGMSAEQRSEALAREIRRGPGEGSGEAVAWRRGQRFEPAVEAVAALGEDETLPAALRCLITGGLQGNGFALARYLVEQRGARLVLVEEDLPKAGTPRAQRLESLRTAAAAVEGASVEVLAAPPADDSLMASAVNVAVTSMGALDLVIHGAGTDGQDTFSALRETGAEELRRHLEPRALGAASLHRALRSLPQEQRPSRAVILGSLASELGGLAYGPYAAANAWLDAFAEAGGLWAEGEAAAGRIPWRVLDWDVWRFDFEDEERQITSLGAGLDELAMSPEEGWITFQRALAVAPGAPRVLVSTADFNSRRAAGARRIEQQRGEGGPVDRPRHQRPDLGSPFSAPESEMEKRIAAVWTQLLGYEPIGLDDNFFELGGDSFIAIRVADRLQKELGRELPVARLYEGLTVRALAAMLSRDEAEEREQRKAQFDDHKASAQRRRAFLDRRRRRLGAEDG